jgi:hypothetical protein
MISGAVRRTKRRIAVWAAVAVVLALVLGLMPLFGILGYELALAASVFAAPCGLDLGAALARSLQQAPGAGIERARYPGRALAATSLVAAGLACAVTLVIAIVCAIRGVWVPTCDWWFGIKAFALVPLATAAWCGAVGHAIATVVGVRERRRWYPHRATVLALVVPLVWCTASALWRFYSAPPAFVYSALIGYYPGNLYDENVQLGATLVWSRLDVAAWVVTFVALVAVYLDVPRFRVSRAARPGGRRWAPTLVALGGLAVALGLHHESATLGFAIEAEDIQAVLDGRIETAHFIIHYARTPEIEKDIQLIAEDHEFRYAQDVATLGAAPEGKLRSYYFANAEQKARWMGARHVEMAKPWRREIYIDDSAFPHRALRHEIAHAVASAFGDPIFGVAMRDGVLANPGLIEGLAVATDWPGDGPLTPHEQVRALQVLGFEPSIRELFSLGFLASSSARSYTTAGSFVRYLLDQYGADKLRALYRSSDDFTGVYGESIDQLDSEWRAVIAKIVLPPGTTEALRERFRGGGVFSRPCPHAIAARGEQAAIADAYGNHERAVALMQQVCGEAPEEPEYRIKLGDYLASGDAHEHDRAIAIWTEIADAPATTITSSLRAEAIKRLIGAAAVHGDLARVTELADRAASLPLDGDARRFALAQQLVAHATGPAASALRAYFFWPSRMFTPHTWALAATAREPTSGLAHYLLGLQARAADRWDLVADELARALSLGLPTIEFVEFGARNLAIAAYRTHDAAKLGVAIAALAGPGTNEVDHWLAREWASRLTFDASGQL